MSSVARPRGPLPARVYWVRRVLLLLVVAGLVVGVQRVLDHDGDGSDPAVAASVVGAPFDVPTLVAPLVTPDMTIKPGRRQARLPQPDGPCDPADVRVTPVVDVAYVGRPVQIILELTTVRSRACELDVTGDTVAVNVSSTEGAGELLWTTQDCPAALPGSTVVARRDVPGRAVAEWSGKHSDEACSEVNAWVMPGTYLVEAVAFGSTEAGEQEFEVRRPVQETLTRTVTPTPTASPGRAADEAAAGSPSATATVDD